MMIILYPLLALLDLSATMFACLLVNWWAPLFATSAAHLPIWLAWFDTFDADLDAGGATDYWGRVAWLYRNPAYGFSYWALGSEFYFDRWHVSRCDQGPGKPFTFIALSDDGRFNVHAIRFGIRFKLGWAAWNMYDATTGKWKSTRWGPAWRIPFVFSVSVAR